MSSALALCRDKQPYNDSFANPAIALHKGNWFGNERERYRQWEEGLGRRPVAEGKPTRQPKKGH